MFKKRIKDSLGAVQSENITKFTDQQILEWEQTVDRALERFGLRKAKEEDYDQDEQELKTVEVPGDSRKFIEVSVLGNRLRCMLDSGSQVTILKYNEQLVKQLNINIKASNVILKMADGTILQNTGVTDIPFEYMSRTASVRAYWAKDLKCTGLCGMSFLNAFDIKMKFAAPPIGQTREQDDGDQSNSEQESIEVVQLEEVEVYSIEEDLGVNQEKKELNVELEELSKFQTAELNKVKRLFKEQKGNILEATTLTEHVIELKEEFAKAKPVYQKPYTVSPHIQKGLFEEIDRLVKIGVIEPAQSDWCLNVIPVKKPSGAIRLCLDARRLNERTVRDLYPQAHIGRILSRLESAKYISTIDLKEAYLQIPLQEESKKYTAFAVPGKGLYQYRRLPFGLSNSPATLSRLIDRILGNGELEPRIFIYLDDIIVLSNNFEEHLKDLADVARRLNTANLTVNLDKSQFCRKELPFLGHIVSPGGIKPNPERVAAIVNFETPKTVRQVRRFLGMSNYYRRFIVDFSGVTAPISDLLKGKPRKIDWTPEAEKAFVKIKQLLISTPILVPPDFSQEFTLQTDASDVAVAGVLTQMQKGSEKVIAYFSQKLTATQQRYHASEKEALAAILAIDHFRGYIEGSHFTLITDSSALTYIMTTRWKTSSRLSRWSLILQQYDVSILHRKGKENIVPDALSRSIASVGTETDSTWYKNLREKIRGNPDKYPDFKVESDQIWKFVSTPLVPGDSRFEWKWIPPPEKKLDIIKKEHDEALHMGFDKTLARIKLRYYWPKMAQDIKQYIRACKTCKECKGSSVPTQPKMGEARIANQPWQIISLDFVGPITMSKAKNQYLLVVLDVFSKWVQLYAVKRIDTKEVCKILKEEWFWKNSAPQILISDNGASFTSRVFKTLLDEFQITHFLITRYHSQANPVERVHRTINACIRTYARNDQREWDTKIKEIQFVLNNTVHSGTGFTPYFILNGHEISLSGEDFKAEPQGAEESLKKYIERTDQIKSTTMKMVKRNLEKAYKKAEHNYNLRIRKNPDEYKIGQLVYRKNFKISNAGERYNAKYGPLFVPCKIVGKRGNSSYELEEIGGKKLGWWPACHIKP